MLNDILSARKSAQQQERHNYENSYKQIMRALTDIKMNYQQIMIEPMEFLSLKF
jgi:hypothetical protein